MEKYVILFRVIFNLFIIIHAIFICFTIFIVLF